jgi:transcriptional regulator with XRE-family HTH domain
VAENSLAGYLWPVPSFGENLKRIRQRSRLKSKDVAERVDVAKSVVSGWENNRRGLPETPTLFKLAKALNCSIEELLQGVDEEYEAAVQKRVVKPDFVTVGGSESEHALAEESAAQREILATVSKLTAAIAGALCQDNDATAEALELWTQLGPDDRASIIEVMKGYRASAPGADGTRGAQGHEPAAKRRRGAERARRHPA